MKRNCKNLFSYPDGTIFVGQEILDFINYHTSHKTGKTKIANYMKNKFGNIKPNMNYKLFFKWARNVDEFENDCVEKPRLLRVDHTSPIVTLYDFYHGKLYQAHYEGLKEIRI